MESNTIFIHIPKCGGSTLREIVQREYGKVDENVWVINRTDDIPLFISLPEDRRRKIRVLIGHGRYGLHDYLYGDSKYFTFFRDPIDRALSAYYYAKLSKRSEVYQRNLSLARYYEGDYGPWDKNIQTKKIAGVVDDTAPCTGREFENALQNLTQNIDFVGFVEYFDESLMALKMQFNWRKMPYYHRKNVTHHRKRVDSLSSADLDLLSEFNKYDMRLYAQAKDLFVNRLFEKTVRLRVDQFQRQNRVVGQWFELVSRGTNRIKRALNRI